jgi:hypothetical protein
MNDDTFAEDDNAQEAYIDENEIQEELMDDGDQPMSDPEDNDAEEDFAGEEGEEMDFARQIEVEDHSVQGFFEHKAPVYAIALNGKHPHMCASGGGDDKSYMWDITTGELIFQLAGFYWLI